MGALWGEYGPAPRPPRDESAEIAQRIEDALDDYAEEVEVELMLVREESDYPFAHTFPVWRYHIRYRLREVTVVCESLIDDAGQLSSRGMLPPAAVTESLRMEPATFAQLLVAYAEVQPGRTFGHVSPLADFWPKASIAQRGDSTYPIEDCWVVTPGPDMSTGWEPFDGFVFLQVRERRVFQYIGAQGEVEGVE